jgi:predicted ATPase/DNA-binding CsgD family transcriptional regulator
MTTEKYRNSNLPAEPNDFVGRERDVDELAQLLHAARLVTLCGPGGIGKTRLALRVAGTMPEPVWFIELADVLAGGGVLQAARLIARTLGLLEEPGHDVTDTLVDSLHGRAGLLVLDNCEHLVEDIALLAQRILLGCPRLSLLATSREPLRIPGENVWWVPPLAVPTGDTDRDAEAVRLFAVRASATRSDFAVTEDNAAAVAELCRALDGVPLALELAAARIRVLSIEQITARLTNRFGLLNAGDRTAAPRQQTLRAAIDWSHDLLSVPERTLLRRLSVFAGFTIEYAERVCGDGSLPADDILDLLTALIDKSLVVVDCEKRGRSRFRLLDSIRQYAAERLAEAGETELVRLRHRDWVLEKTEWESAGVFAQRESTWIQLVEIMAEYETEIDNIRNALVWSLERGDVEAGLRLCTAMRMYGVAVGEFAEWAGWTDRFLARADEAPAGVTGAALVTRAYLAVEMRDFTMMQRCTERGVELCRAAGDTSMLAAGLDLLAQHDVQRGRFDSAASRLDEAMALTVASGDRWNEALTYYVKGSWFAMQNRGREARKVYEQGIACMRAIDHRWGAARGLILLGLLAQSRGDLHAAREHFTEALGPLRDVDARPEIARSLGGIGRMAAALGDLPAAREALTESLTISRSLGIRVGVARGLDAFAELHAIEGDGKRAVRLAGAAAALRESIGQPPTNGARLEKMLEPIRKQFSETIVAQLWGRGRELGMDAAIELALRPPADPGTVPAPRVPRHDVGGHAMPVTPPSTLTTREREIALLIARGLSNKGIADELVISPATVARHVTNILTKLGFASRAQVAVWAVDNGLT